MSEPSSGSTGADRQVAVVSGASRGIGAATARVLGRRGYHVIVNYLRDHAAADAVVATIVAAGGSASAVQADVTDTGQSTALVDDVLRDHGRIDVLVCNANVEHPTLVELPDLAWEKFAAKVDRELAAAYLLTQRVLAAMCPRRTGRIVYVSSIAGDMIGGGMAHGVAKAALNAFSRHVAVFAGRHGITVNTVSPGPVDTEATAGLLPDAERTYIAERTVGHRVMAPEEVARVIGVLVDDTADLLSGQIITVDSGLSLLSRP
jgi:3-oxoacyl-[acyl-carrier protein] reductase